MHNYLDHEDKEFHKENKKNIIFGIILNGSFTILEFVVGLLSNSLALMSDALHDLTDTFALLLSWFAAKKSEKPASLEKTWGYHRATILAAFVNGLVLVILTLFIFYRAYLRILNPEHVEGQLVLGLAVFGILFNGAIVLKLWKSKDRDVNIRSIFWHISEDALGWIGVLIAGIAITFTDLYIIDPIVSILIGLIVLRGAWGILKETTNILLEAVPENMSIKDVKTELMKIKPIEDVHDLHVWTFGSNHYAASTHVKIPDMKICDTNDILKKIQKTLGNKFHITHSTIAFESTDCKYNNKH